MPVLNRQRWPDYSAPASTTTVDISTQGSITFTGQGVGLTISVAISTPGSVTFTGQDLPISLDVPHVPTVTPKSLLAMRRGPSPRGPPLLVQQRFPSYLAGTSTTTVDVSTPGAITFTGQDAAFTITVNIGTAGAATFTGQSVTGNTVASVATAGQMTFTGQSVATQQSQALTAGAVTFTGQSVASTTTVNIGTAGQVVFTGQTVTPQTVASVSTAGALTFTGQTVATTNTVAITTAGTVLFTGQDLTVVVTIPTPPTGFPALHRLRVSSVGPPILARQRFDSYAAVITVDISTAGQVTFTGQSLATSISVPVSAAGQVTFTGQSVASTTTVNIGTAGQLTLTGQALTPSVAATVSTAGAVTFTGQALPTTNTVNIDGGQVTFTGQDLTVSVTQPTVAAMRPSLPGRMKALFRGPPILVRQRFDVPQAVTTTVDVATPGSVTFTGQSVATTQSQAVSAGAVTLTGQSLGLKTTVNIGTAGAVTFTGQSVGATSTAAVSTAGQVTFTGQSIGLVRAVAITAGAVTFTGSSVGATVSVAVTPGQVTFTGSTITVVAPGGGVVLPITKEGRYTPSIYLEGALTQLRKEGRWGVLTGLPEPVGSSGTGPGPATAPGLTGAEFDITDYGAAIDGTTDDTAAVVAALAAADASNGTVLHPGGTSMISSNVAVPSGVTLAGVGPSSIFKALPGLTGKFMFEIGVVGTSDDVTVRDLAFDLDNVTQAAALRYRTTNRLLVDRCHFSNSVWYFIHESSSFADGLTPLASDITIRDSVFTAHTGTSRECVIAAYVTDFLVERCRFEDTNLGFSIYRAAFDTVVRDSEFINVTSANPNAILYGRGCDGVLITNCYFSNAGSLSQAAVRGCQPGSDYILNGGLGVDPNYRLYIQNVQVDHCTFVDCGTPVQVGAVVGYRDVANRYESSLGTAVLVNTGNTNAEFVGYASRDLTFYGSSFDSNMLTGGTAAVFFNSTQAGVNLQASVRRCTFSDTGVTQTRAVAFAGDGVPANSIFSGASIDTSNTSNVLLIRLLTSATGVTLENATAATELGGAYLPSITKHGRHRPSL